MDFSFHSASESREIHCYLDPYTNIEVSIYRKGTLQRQRE